MSSTAKRKTVKRRRPRGPASPPRRRRPSTTPKPRARRKRAIPWRRSLAIAVKWSLTAVIWTALAGGVVVAALSWDLPDITGLGATSRQPGIRVLAADGARIASYGEDYGAALGLAELPPHLPQAVLAIEDRRFHDHIGIDLIALARAAIVNLRAGGVRQGGSTLTQQIAKNLFLSADRTIKRKVQEAILALTLESRFTKDELLTIYLNRVYMGAGTFGVDAAAHRYFGKSARELSLHESAVLAGLLRAPSRFNPAHDVVAANARARGPKRHGRCRLHFGVHGGGGATGRAAAPGRPNTRAQPALLRRLGADAGRRLCRRRRRRSGSGDHPRSEIAGGGRKSGDGSVGKRLTKPSGAGGAAPRWRRGRHDRRPGLRRQPIQSRDPSAASARLGLQADRLSGGGRSRVRGRFADCRYAGGG